MSLPRHLPAGGSATRAPTAFHAPAFRSADRPVRPASVSCASPTMNRASSTEGRAPSHPLLGSNAGRHGTSPKALPTGGSATRAPGPCLVLVRLILPLLAWTCASLTLPAAPLETATEFHARGDLDGDGREDLVIVEKATGIYRVAHQSAPGTYTWAEARAGGVPNVTAVSLGHVLATTRDALVLASPEANRVNVFDAASATLPATPVPWFPPSVGPQAVVAIDLGGAGNTAHDDLFAVTVLNDAPGTHRQALARVTAAGIAPFAAGAAGAAFERGDRVQLKAGAPLLLGLVSATGGGSFHTFNLASGAPVAVATAGGLSPDARFVFHRFGAGALHQFLFYRPGTSTLHLRAVLEPVPGTFAFAAPTLFDLGKPIDAVAVLPGAAAARLLVLHAGGTSAAVYAFDGTAPPALIQSINPSPGSRFTGANATGDLGTMLFQGSPDTGRSANWRTLKWDGVKYVESGSGALPDSSPYAAAANVFVFRNEPFVNPGPVLVQRLAAGDWTSAPSLAGAPLKVNVVVETFGGSTQGLGSPTPRNLGDVTSPGAFALANQYTPSISLFTFLPPIGDEAVEVQVSPPPGPQSAAIQVALSASVAGASIYYRIDDATVWTPYSAPFVLFRDAAVAYYAQVPASNRKSVIRTASYTFPVPPSELDSDADGVPDYAELGLDANNNGTPDYAELGAGLDPVTGGKDADGDGFNDLDEFVAGTNPYSAASAPAIGSRLEDRSGFDLFVTPRPMDGPANALSTARTGLNVRLLTLQGELLRFDRTTNYPSPAPPFIPTARQTNVSIDTGQRWLVLATEPHFAIDTANADQRLGRELVGFFPVPPVAAGLNVVRPLGNGTLKTEAAAWRSAAQAAAAAQPRLELVRDLAPRDTLVALLAERKIELLLNARGLNPTNPISLLSFRTADAGRYVPTAAELSALERETAGQPAFLLVDLHAALSNAVATVPTASLGALRQLSDEVYRLSSASNNAAPGVLPLPVEALREFLRTGVLESNYLARTALNPAQLAAAATGVGEALALPGSRPKTTVALTAAAGGVNPDCTTLVAAGQPISLFFADGSAFLFPASFELVAGSTIEVTGYTDLPPGIGGCPGESLEVIEARVLTVPAVPILDADGDLLPDNYECAFFGSTAANPLGDEDLDTFTNLQEFLDGTDPKDQLAKGVAPVVILPPVIELGLKLGGTLGLKWTFPSAYAGKFKFGVRSADSLDSLFHEVPVTVTSLGSDEFEVNLPLPAGDTQFYVLYFQLK